MSIEELVRKARTYAEELRALHGFDAVHALWQRTSFPYTLNEKDPSSQAYKAEVLGLYQMLTQATYDVNHELTSNLQTSASEFEIGFPWSTGNMGVICAELAKVTQAFKALQEAGISGKRVIEFGSGWGNLAIPLARSRQDVTVVDIDAGFLARLDRIAQRENLKIPSIEADFLGACDKVTEKFDAAIFQASFHHCLDFNELLRDLKSKVLTRDGKLFFFSEPIFDHYDFPWGIRYDGESLWAVMFNRWLELGFDRSYFSKALLDAGFFLERIEGVSGYVGPGWRASQVHTDIALGDWVLPNDYGSTFHDADAGARQGRFCKAISRIPASATDSVYRLGFINYAPHSLKFSVSCENEVRHADIRSNERLEISIPSKGREITITSQMFCPHQCIAGSQDKRQLGVHLASIAAQNKF